MGKTLAVLTCSLAACVLFAGCSHSTTSQPSQATSPPPGPGVLIIDAADKPTPQRSAKSYRIANSTIPAGDFEALKEAIIAASKDMPQQDPNWPRLIVQADANVAAEAIAPVVMTAINCGFDAVDLDGNLPAPARMQVSDQPPPDPILVRVITSFDGGDWYELTGVGVRIVSEHELRELLKRKREKGSPDTPILVEPMGQTKDEFTLTAYTQAISAGFKRFVAPRAPYLPHIDIPQPKHPPWPPDCTIFGLPVEAHNVVYVCDRSRSLTPMFDMVRRELLKSISKLHPQQDFAVLMMAEGKPLESDPYGLVPASIGSKLRAAKFLNEVTGGGSTTVLPCLKRAFEMLGAADKTRPGKVIYIVTDGDFDGGFGGSSYTAADGRELRGNEAVIQYLRDHNADKEVQINTILLFRNDKAAVKVMKQIAAENGGAFRFVSQDE